jgi:hypothetical protein
LGAADALPRGGADAVNEAYAGDDLQIEYWSEGTGGQPASGRAVPARAAEACGTTSATAVPEGRRTFRVATTKSVRVLAEYFTPRADIS